MEQLLQLDIDILLAINGFHNDLLDTFFWNVSSKFIWIPMYAVMLFLLIRRYGKRSIWLILALIAAFALSDSLCHLIKHMVCRPRPSHNELLTLSIHFINNYHGGHYGFPSQHAANTFAIALLFCLIWGRGENDTKHRNASILSEQGINSSEKTKHRNASILVAIPLFIWTALNCLSRVYLAVHYPTDILAGIIFGTIIALGVYLVLLKTKVFKMTDMDGNENKADKSLPMKVNYLPLIILTLTLISCCIWHKIC